MFIITYRLLKPLPRSPAAASVEVRLPVALGCGVSSGELEIRRSLCQLGHNSIIIIIIINK